MNPSRILVVEDEAIVAMEIMEHLGAAGYDAAGCAATGESALALVREHHPDLVLMDIRLKGDMDGIDAAREIRRNFHLPVIFLTAYSEDLTLERAKLAEPYGYVLKPFNGRELKSVIEIALFRHGAEEEILRLNRIYDVFSHVNQTIVHTRNPEELFSAICRLMVERGGLDMAWIGRLDSATSKVCPVAGFGCGIEAPGELGCCARGSPEEGGIPDRAVREGCLVICDRCSKVPRAPSVETSVRFGFKSCGSFPLRFQGRIYGALTICTAAPAFFREKEIELLKEVASDISFALDKIEADSQRRLAEDALREAYQSLQLMVAEAQAANIAKSRFLSNMSHEFRTPLQGVFGGAMLLIDTPLTPDQRRYVEMVKSSGEEILSIINAIFDFSNLEADVPGFEAVEVNIRAMLSELWQTMDFRAQGKGLEFIYTVDPRIPSPLYGDPDRLRQIMTILAGNAIKYTDKGSVVIRVVRASEDAASVRLSFEIADTGVGIPRKRLGDLFMPFHQLDMSNTRKHRGIGLGLAIARMIASSMGGEIGVESEEGNGSTFRFTAVLQKQQ